MKTEALLMFRGLCVVGLVVTLAGGWYLMKNRDRILGSDSLIPSESSSSRGLSKVQIVAIWLHLAAFFIMGLLAWH